MVGETMDISRNLACLLLPAGLASCSTIETGVAPGQPNLEDATIEGYRRFYVLYYELGGISAVDGKRPGGFVGYADTVRLPPGEHWIEIKFERYAFGGGGSYATCAFKFRFEAQHRYQVKAHSLKADVGLLAHPLHDPYIGSITLGVSAPEGFEKTEDVATLCATPNQILCVKNSDCGSGRYCDMQSGHEFGVCKWPTPKTSK